jgi:hypothetical protein
VRRESGQRARVHRSLANVSRLLVQADLHAQSHDPSRHGQGAEGLSCVGWQEARLLRQAGGDARPWWRARREEERARAAALQPLHVQTSQVRECELAGLEIAYCICVRKRSGTGGARTQPLPRRPCLWPLLIIAVRAASHLTYLTHSAPLLFHLLVLVAFHFSGQGCSGLWLRSTTIASDAAVRLCSLA